jgi:hypothetical protein
MPEAVSRKMPIKIYEIVLQIGKMAGGITFIFGIFYGLFQFFETKKEAQIEQTLALYRQFNSPPVTTYRESIFAAVAKHQAEIAAAAVEEAELEKVVTNMVKQEGVENHLIMIMDFYDGLVFCVTKNICDAETALDLFYGRSRELYNLFYQHIRLQRRSWASSDFGLGLQTFAEMKNPK